jgi:hypothetical protein
MNCKVSEISEPKFKVSLRVAGFNSRPLKGNQGILTTQWECVSMLTVISTEGCVRCSEKRAPLCDAVIKKEINMKS